MMVAMVYNEADFPNTIQFEHNSPISFIYRKYNAI